MHTNNKIPIQLHSLNAMRVIAEYFVIRYHVLPNHIEKEEENIHQREAIGLDIMSFFFVLSGFVLMYRYEREDFSTLASKRKFVEKRIYKMYPIFFINWLFCLPMKIISPSPSERTCWFYTVCPALQLLMLDCWFGCGYNFIFIGVSWFISCIIWLWVLFPFIKEFLVRQLFKQNFIWSSIIIINCIWAYVFYLLWDYDIYTLSPTPILRVGEFLTGCGTALSLKQDPLPTWISKAMPWILFSFLTIVYNLECVDHGIDSICLREKPLHDDCSIWHAGQKQLTDVKPPCVTIFEKFYNKYAIIWAYLIHWIAKKELKLQETENTSGWLMRVLQADIFKFLSKFSLTLYLSHYSMNKAIEILSEYLMNLKISQWKDDTLMLSVYISCYGLHSGVTALSAWIIGFTHKSNSLEIEHAELLEKAEGEQLG